MEGFISWYFYLYYCSPFPSSPEERSLLFLFIFLLLPHRNLVQRRETKIFSDLIQIQNGMKTGPQNPSKCRI